MNGDIRVVACNYREGTRVTRWGALAYVCWTNPGGGNNRIPILARSRSCRWVRKWEKMSRLANFRHKTIPPQHPRYGQIARECVQLGDQDLAHLNEACLREWKP